MIADRDVGTVVAAAHDTPSRVDVVERLDRAGLLPAIVFVFSRAGCDAAVLQCLRSGLRLTTNVEARRGPWLSSSSGAPTSPRRTSAILGYHDWLEGLGTRHRGSPRRHAADLQGGRRGAVRPRPRTSRLRHRDAGPRHQHARAIGGARAAQQVERRDPRRRDAGGVHPAHRSRRTSRHRRRGPRRRAVAARIRPQGRRGPGVDADVPAAFLVPAELQHGRQPRRAGRAPAVARHPRAVVRAVPGRPGGRRPDPAGQAQRGGARGLSASR